MIIAAAVIVIAIVSITGFNIGEEVTPEDEALLEQASCNIDSAIGVRTIPEDEFTKGTNVDVATFLYSTEWQRLDSADDQSNLDASPMAQYYVFAYDDGTANADGSADWYGEIKEVDTDCKDPYDVYFAMYKEIATTVIGYNDDGSVNANTSNEQTLAANSEYDLEIKITAPNDGAFGAPSGDANILVCFDYNTSAYDEIKIEGATKKDVPSFDIATSEECWELERVTFMDAITGGREKETYTVHIDTDNTNAPSSDDINVRLMDGAMYVNGDTGMPEYGVADEDGDDVGLAVANNVVIYTA